MLLQIPTWSNQPGGTQGHSAMKTPNSLQARSFHPIPQQISHSNDNTVAQVQITYRRSSVEALRPLNRPQKVYECIIHCFPSSTIEYKERMVAILLDSGLKPLGWTILGEGSTNGCLLNIPELMQLALLTHSTGIILAHNHPSGRLQPSGSDRLVTKKLKDACALLDMQLRDHLIVSPHGFYSFADHGDL